ncbi:hypothetical protein, partial [Arthrobacter livingstonensis]|uniref:hypothetical protein n=1 Tax=Arthrobacter livingstonensis TaxID=670078 RepID=UPI001B87EB21
ENRPKTTGFSQPRSPGQLEKQYTPFNGKASQTGVALGTLPTASSGQAQSARSARGRKPLSRPPRYARFQIPARLPPVGTGYCRIRKVGGFLRWGVHRSVVHLY